MVGQAEGQTQVSKNTLHRYVAQSPDLSIEKAIPLVTHVINEFDHEGKHAPSMEVLKHSPTTDGTPLELDTEMDPESSEVPRYLARQ